jgi:hypothetical protein
LPLPSTTARMTEERSDVIHDRTDDDDDVVSDDDVSDNEDKETDEDVFFWAAREIMNRSNKKIGTAAMEEFRFRSFFGARNEIVLKVWKMLGEGGLRPKNSKPKHLLWALYFLKVYSREGPICSAVGGSKGAIDPKTMRKWVWLFLERIAELADNVVSYLFRRNLAGHCLN